MDECTQMQANAGKNGLSGWSVPFKSEFKSGIKWVLRSNTLSPHFVSTLCRLRFVFTLRPYALSKAKDG